MINEEDINARKIVLDFLETLQNIASGELKTNSHGVEMVDEGKRDASMVGGGGGGGGGGEDAQDASSIVKSPRKAKRRLLHTLQNDDRVDQAFVRTFRSVTSLFIQ